MKIIIIQNIVCAESNAGYQRSEATFWFLQDGLLENYEKKIWYHLYWTILNEEKIVLANGINSGLMCC